MIVGLDARDITAHLSHPGRVLDLTGRRPKAQVELLLLEIDQVLFQLVVRLRPDILGLHRQLPSG